MKKFLTIVGAIVLIGGTVAGVAYLVYRYLDKKKYTCECDDECCFLDDDEENECCCEESNVNEKDDEGKTKE